jgi:hypothetical protein
MGGSSVGDLIDASSDWDAHFAREQAKGEQFLEWWSDPWNNFWRPIGEDFADNPGHLLGGTVATANLMVVPGVGGIRLLQAARAANAAKTATALAASRADELQAALPVGSQGRVTMAVGVGEDANGATRTIVGTSEPNGYLRPGVTLNPGEEIATAGGHAEVSILTHMQELGLRPVAVGAGRPICVDCALRLQNAGATPATAIK